MATAEALLNEAYEALSAGDVAALLDLCTSDVTLHIPGRGPQSGTYRGAEGVSELVAKLGDLSDGTLRVELSEVLGDGALVAALAFIVAEKEGRSLDARVVHVWEIREGKLARMWSHPADQYEIDDFYSDSLPIEVVPVADDEDEAEEAAIAAEPEPEPAAAAPGEDEVLVEAEGLAEIEAEVAAAAAGEATVIAPPPVDDMARPAAPKPAPAKAATAKSATAVKPAVKPAAKAAAAKAVPKAATAKPVAKPAAAKPVAKAAATRTAPAKAKPAKAAKAPVKTPATPKPPARKVQRPSPVTRASGRARTTRKKTEE